MTPVSPSANTLRGEHHGRTHVTWRLDGSTADPRAPLVLALHGKGMSEDFFARWLRPLFRLPYRFLVPRGFHPMHTNARRRVGGSWYAYDGDQERFRLELERVEAGLITFLEGIETELGLQPAARVTLGFSQGGYLGSYVALRHLELFDGMVVAGARVKIELLERELHDAGRQGFRAFLCHGQQDPSVSPAASISSQHALAAQSIETELHSFEGGHTLGPAQVAVIGDWLVRHFG